jgi:hypothetical protein
MATAKGGIKGHAQVGEGHARETRARERERERREKAGRLKSDVATEREAEAAGESSGENLEGIEREIRREKNNGSLGEVSDGSDGTEREKLVRR